MLEKLRNKLPIIIAAIVMIAALAVPELIETHMMHKFAEPLYEHALAGDDIVLHKGVQYQLDGENKIAVILLRSDMDQAEIYEFYSDILDMEFAVKKYVLLDVEEVVAEDAAVELIKDKGYYDQSLHYYYVYIYTDPMAKPLFSHPLPANSVVLDQDIVYAEDDDRKTVYIHLETEMTAEETELFYADVLTTELAQKEEHLMQVTPMTKDELAAYQDRGDYREDMNYFTVAVFTP